MFRYKSDGIVPKNPLYKELLLVLLSQPYFKTATGIADKERNGDMIKEFFPLLLESAYDDDFYDDDFYRGYH